MKQKCVLARTFLRSRQLRRRAKHAQGEAQRLARKAFCAYYTLQNYILQEKIKYFQKSVDKLDFMLYNKSRSVGDLCNGSTTDSDSVCQGSNP